MNHIFNKTLCSLILFLGIIVTNLMAQYPSPVGLPGTTAMHKDSSAFFAWATGCTINRGWQDISNHAIGLASVGDSTMATGIAGSNGVISLGDGGVATLTFEWPLVNGESWDFAVFENSFNDFFLELAFVEVSSDGLNYFRFPANSLTDTNKQVSSFDSLDATKINNLAGKYRGMYGTPFDLEELIGEPGLDVNHITHIRLIDVVGCIQNAFATFDSTGRKINDPWPTGFPSGGFDLDAIGVIWNTVNSFPENASEEQKILLFPNPTGDNIHLSIPSFCSGSAELFLCDITGKQLKWQNLNPEKKEFVIDLIGLKAGVYLLHVITEDNTYTEKLLKK